MDTCRLHDAAIDTQARRRSGRAAIFARHRRAAGGRNAPTSFQRGLSSLAILEWAGADARGAGARSYCQSGRNGQPRSERGCGIAFKADRSYVEAFTAAFGADEPVQHRAFGPSHRGLRAHAHHPRLRPMTALCAATQTPSHPYSSRGMAAFESAALADCHAGPNFAPRAADADRGGAWG